HSPGRLLWSARVVRGGRRGWSLTVGAALAVLAMAPPAQGDPFAYVTDSASYDVSQYEIAAGGILAPLSPPTVGADASPIGVAVSPDGKSVYVANYGTNAVSQYEIGRASCR